MSIAFLPFEATDGTNCFGLQNDTLFGSSSGYNYILEDRKKIVGKLTKSKPLI